MSLVEIALGTAFVGLFWEGLRPGGAALWIIALWALVALRLITFKRASRRPALLDWTPPPVLVANLASGAVLWSMTSLLLSNRAPIIAQVSAPLASALVASAACGFFTVRLRAAAAYIIPNMVALILVAVLIDKPIVSQGAMLALVFLSLGIGCRIWHGKLVAEFLSLRDQLLHAKQVAETASAVKSSIIAHMSHELRTPLNAIIGFSEVMDQQILGPIGNARYADYARNIHSSASHLLEIINDILDLSRIESGKSEFNETEVDVGCVVEFTARMVRESAKNSGVTIETQVAGDLPHVVADERMVKQMLLNLLSNAVKFTPMGGQVVISAGMSVTGEICILVKDTGIGVAAEDLQRIFEPFVQVEGPFNRRHQGTGLGLSLVRAMAEQHHARLELESEVGRGTIARICFPTDRVIQSYAEEPSLARIA